MVSFKEAIEILFNSIKPKNIIELVDFNSVLNRVLAEDIYAIRNIPPYNNSAMDGYAFRFDDIDKPLRVKRVIYAGDVVGASLKDKECYKIMTGAKVPDDADTIAPKEICEEIDGFVTVKQKVKRFNALRFMGEEIKKEELLLKRGEILTPAKIALLASQGITSCQVYKKLTIAIVSSGDELKEPWEEASVNEIYNINAINLQMYLKEYGFDSTYLGKIPDNVDEIKKFINKLQDFDIVISSGGISKGDKDFILDVCYDCGFKELFRGVNIKPGRPTTFGFLGDTLLLALPGNPLATIANFLLLGLKAIYLRAGAENFEFNRCKVVSGVNLSLNPNRTNIVFGSVDNGFFIPYKNNKYGSGMIMPLVKSNAILVSNEGVSNINIGDEVEVLMI